MINNVVIGPNWATKSRREREKIVQMVNHTKIERNILNSIWAVFLDNTTKVADPGVFKG